MSIASRPQHTAQPVDSPNRTRRQTVAALLGAPTLLSAPALLLGGCASPAPHPLDRLPELIAQASAAVVAISDLRGGQGSGFRVGNTQMIVTAAHVVARLEGPAQVMWQGRPLRARVLRVDNHHDLALLTLDGAAPMPGLTLHTDAAQLPPGTWVVVLGCPFGSQVTATTGIVSAPPGAVAHPARLRPRLQLNVAVNPGNSGGPVLALDGRVVGVATDAIPGASGLGFASPAAALAQMLTLPGP